MGRPRVKNLERSDGACSSTRVTVPTFPKLGMQKGGYIPSLSGAGGGPAAPVGGHDGCAGVGG